MLAEQPLSTVAIVSSAPDIGVRQREIENSSQ